MNRGLIAYSVIPIAIILLFLELGKTKTVDFCDITTEGLALNYTVANDLEQSNVDNASLKHCFASINLGKSFVGFKEAVAFKESRGDYFTVNTLGYLGKYQFGKGTLKLVGIHDANKFLNDPKLQEKAFIANTMRNKWILRREIKSFVGKTIDGIQVTESGILAAAHLAGPGSVKKYLRSYGAIGFADAYGTTIKYYMKRFAGYDMSFIEGKRKAKASKI